MGVQMEVTGLRQITNALRAYVEDWPAVERAALEKAGALVLEAAKEKVPARTGFLESNLVVTKVKQGRDATAYIQVGVNRNKGAAYGIPVEFGHVNHDGTITSPISFIGAAYEEKKAEAYDLIKATILEEMTKRRV